MYKILIVEDTRVIREEIYDILLLEGYTVLQAENGDIGDKMALKKPSRSYYFRHINA